MSDEYAFLQRGGKDDWQTPPEITEPIAAAHDGIDLDPCAGPETDIGDDNIRPPANGLERPWHGVVFMNPPFATKTEWLAKAAQESQRDAVDAVYVLTPDSTDVASWWHEFIAEYAPASFYVVSRCDFINPETGEQASGVSFNTAVSVFGEAPADLLCEWNRLGDLQLRPQVDYETTQRFMEALDA